MDKIREQLLQDVTDAVNSGEVTSFWDYPDLLLEYDDHAPLKEGMEGAPVYVYDESGAHVPSGMDGEGGDVPCDACVLSAYDGHGDAGGHVDARDRGGKADRAYQIHGEVG